MHPHEHRKLLNTHEAAAYCGSTRSTFEKLRVLGGSAPYLKIGRRVLYDMADLEAWLESKRRNSTSEQG